MVDLPSYPDTSDDPDVEPDRGPPPSTPRWVYMCGILVLLLILMVIIMMFTGGGEHGLGRHTLPSSVTERGMQQR